LAVLTLYQFAPSVTFMGLCYPVFPRCVYIPNYLWRQLCQWDLAVRLGWRHQLIQFILQLGFYWNRR